MEFEWNQKKNNLNIKKHGVSFFEAQDAFFDKYRVITFDLKHSTDKEKGIFALVKLTIKL